MGNSLIQIVVGLVENLRHSVSTLLIVCSLNFSALRSSSSSVDFVVQFRNLTVLEDVLALVMFENLQLKTNEIRNDICHGVNLLIVKNGPLQ